MQTTTLSQRITEQQNKLELGSPKIEIIAPCLLNDGIIELSEEQVQRFIEVFENRNEKLLFFIPASGSGSRMFDFLNASLSDDSLDDKQQLLLFLDRLNEFAFFDEGLANIFKRWKAAEISAKDCVRSIIELYNFGQLPKGLISFHKTTKGTLNAFQEHLFQGLNLQSENIKFHFTIQENFKDQFSVSLERIQGKAENEFDVEFSCQDPETDSFTFDRELKLIHKEEGDPLRRPAGHGALIENLSQIEDRFILIKNIDNVQHLDRSERTTEIWKVMAGMLFHVKNRLSELYFDPDVDGLIELNNKYHLFSGRQIDECSDEELFRSLLNRPLRICGMVKNEGKAGGGPFFVKDEGHVTKQIVEAVQISATDSQQEKLNESTHFNPVMMALDTYDFEGNRFELKNFRNEEKYFVVQKKYQGKEISFIELPGLWNGAMYHWNTIFIEIPIDAFTPVKTVFDLLEPVHSEK